MKLNLKRSSKSLRDAAVISIMRWTLYNRAKLIWPDVHLTYGFITKNTRIKNSLKKSHRVDARCISGNPSATPCAEWWQMRQARRHNRQIHKSNTLPRGRKKLNQTSYLVKGFRLFDKVRYNRSECFIFGRRSNGYFDIRDIDGTKIHPATSFKKLTFILPSGTLLTKRNRQFPPETEDFGVSLPKFI